MSIRASSLHNYSTTAIADQIGSKYRVVKSVANDLPKIEALYEAIADGSFQKAVSVADLTVQMIPNGQDPYIQDGVLYLPEGTPGVPGADGEDAPKIASVEAISSNSTYTTIRISLEDGSSYNIELLNGKTPVKGVDYFDGKDGKSAYEIWLEQGNTGTKSDFIQAMRGPMGYTGSDGLTPIVDFWVTDSGDLMVDVVGYASGSDASNYSDVGEW